MNTETPAHQYVKRTIGEAHQHADKLIGADDPQKVATHAVGAAGYFQAAYAMEALRRVSPDVADAVAKQLDEFAEDSDTVSEMADDWHHRLEHDAYDVDPRKYGIGKIVDAEGSVVREHYTWAMATRDIAALTPLSWGEVSELTRSLESEDLVHPHDAVPPLMRMARDGSASNGLGVLGVAALIKAALAHADANQGEEKVDMQGYLAETRSGQG